MKLRKTPMSERTKYTYHFNNGDKVVLEPGKVTTMYGSGGVSVEIDESITEITIKDLHAEDDKEVYQNLKHLNCEDYEERQKRIALKKKWDEEHPEGGLNPYEHPQRVVNIDSLTDDDGEEVGDKSKVLYQAALMAEDDEDDDIDEHISKIREAVATFPKSMQELYKLHYIERLSQVEIAKKLKVAKSSVSMRLKKLEEKIYKYFSKR